MSEKRRDSKGRVLRNGESQRSDGKYMFRYTDSTGERHTVYKLKTGEYRQAKGGTARLAGTARYGKTYSEGP